MDDMYKLYSNPTASETMEYWDSIYSFANPVIKPKRDVFVKTLKTVLSKGFFDEGVWEEENQNYRYPCLNGWNVFPC
mgnify:CR=1 FL=1